MQLLASEWMQNDLTLETKSSTLSSRVLSCKEAPSMDHLLFFTSSQICPVAEQAKGLCLVGSLWHTVTYLEHDLNLPAAKPHIG